jgi:enoyl-CoA hydratase/carnithine racemase
MNATVDRWLEHGIATITLNRPAKHNAIDNHMSAALRDAVTWATETADAKVIVVRGAGRSFSAGRDTTVLGNRPGGIDLPYLLEARETNMRLRESPKPVIAELHGHVLGMGFELALSADFRVAADDVQLGLPEVNFGLMTDAGGLPALAELAGPSRAKFLLMTGQRIGAAEAYGWHILDQVVGLAELPQATTDLSRNLATKSSTVLGLAKRTVDTLHRSGRSAAADLETVAQLALFAGRRS